MKKPIHRLLTDSFSKYRTEGRFILNFRNFAFFYFYWDILSPGIFTCFIYMVTVGKMVANKTSLKNKQGSPGLTEIKLFQRKNKSYSRFYCLNFLGPFLLP